MSLIKCPECGNEISSNAKSCPKCGCEVTICPDCGAVYAGKTEICKNCGYKFKIVDQKTDKDDKVLKKAEQFVKAEKIVGITLKISDIAEVICAVIGMCLLFYWQNSDPLKQLDNYESIMTQTRTFAVLVIIFDCISSSIILFSSENSLILQILFSRFLNASSTDCLQYCKQNINIIKDKKNIKTYKFITASAYYQKNSKVQKLSYFIGIIACIFDLLATIFFAKFIFNCIDTFVYNVFYGLEIKFNSFNYTNLIIKVVLSLISVLIWGILESSINKKEEKLLMANSLPVNIG